MIKASNARIMNIDIKIKNIAKNTAVKKPKKRKDLKVIRAPKRTIAQDAPSKKLTIL
jgi:hypothetical protein